MSSHLLMSEELSDVTLKVQYGGYSWRFPGHSLLLQSKSNYLKELIEDRAGEEHPITIPILGIHPDSVLAILNYIYTGEFPLNITTDLLLAAEKFGLRTLRNYAEDELIPRLTVNEACQLLEGFQNVRDCTVKMVCTDIIEKHAYTVFSTDLVLGLSRNVLINLLKSDNLNVPDERVIFWGVWRWGRKHCCQNNKPLTEGSVANYLDEMLVFIRRSNLRRAENIPAAIQERFNRCLPRRTRYEPPDDSVEQSSTWRTCDSWVDLVDVVKGERGTICLEVSFSRKVMVVGLALEIVADEQSDAILQLFRESDGRELLRQKVNCFRCEPKRKLSRAVAEKGEPESWLESNVLFLEPLILSRMEIYSVCLSTRNPSTLLPRSLLSPRRKRMGSTTVSRHGQAVVAVRELYFVPDIEATWGPPVA